MAQRRKPIDPHRSADTRHEWCLRHLERLDKWSEYAPLELTGWKHRRVHYREVGHYQFSDTAWEQFEVGDSWGGPTGTSLLRTTVTLPPSHRHDDVALFIDMDGGETQVKINGVALQGLDFFRRFVPLGALALEDGSLELLLEAFIINYPYDARRGDVREVRTMKAAQVVRRDREVQAAVDDLRFVYDAYCTFLQEDAPREIEGFYLEHLRAACRLIGGAALTQSEARERAVAVREYLRNQVFESGLYRRRGTLSIVPHSHLDLIYLWPLKETIRKNCRTITNMLSLMREDLGFTFSYSQPYLYESLKEQEPEIFKQVKARIAEGRWEPVGAMYVEPDGNLLGAESFVRQLTFGIRTLREEFGVESPVCWMPDVFGMMYTLPQILSLAGVKYCFTTKLSVWNDTNDFPYQSFRWRGPDGSEVLTHFPPSHFAQECNYSTLHKHSEGRHSAPGIDSSLYVYGLADGGGGPTRRMNAMTNRANGAPGLPKARVTSIAEFFDELAKEQSELPVWQEELYLEAHRGVYTTKGELKRLNRDAEVQYHDTEFLLSLAWLCGMSAQQKVLNEGWKLLLLHQFHDTLPGTHVPEATDRIHRDYAQIFSVARELEQQAVEYLDKLIPLPEQPEDGNATQLLIYNTLGWERTDCIKLPVEGVSHSASNNYRLSCGDERYTVQQWKGEWYSLINKVPSLGWAAATLIESEAGEPQDSVVRSAEDGVFETSRYVVRYAADGTLTSVLDKSVGVAGREVLAGPAGEFQLFRDAPGEKFSAWDVAHHLEEYRAEVHCEQSWQLVTNGPLFAILEARWSAGQSTISQQMKLFAHSGRIQFDTRVDWKEREKMLKVAFPVAVRASQATYDLPFGSITRPTHRNTGWEQAKFEVSGHKWVDLSESSYGVSILSECKYGYDVRENVMRLSLLRSPRRPDPESDLGQHEFSYALYPHKGSWQQGGVSREAYALCYPLRSFQRDTERSATADTGLPAEFSLWNPQKSEVVVENVKLSEEGKGLVVRCYEHCGNRLSIPAPAKERGVSGVRTFESVAEVTLLEELMESEASDVSSLEFRPFEIKSLLMSEKSETP